METNGLVLGAMYFGTRADEATSFALLDRFVEAGGRTIDTANCYAFWADPSGVGGQSESVVGRWLASNPGVDPGVDVEIATKVGVSPVAGGVEGLSAAVVAGEFARSQERLGVEVIDVYWAHGEDRSVPLEETVSAFGALVAQGVVRRLGISNHPTWRVERARAIAAREGLEPFTALQLSTSYVEPRPGAPVPGKDHRFGFASDETRDYLTEHPELELWAYSPLLQGAFDRADRALPDAYLHLGTQRRIAALRQIALELGVRPGQVVLAWLLAGGPAQAPSRTPVRPIVGVSDIAQLDEALAAARLELTDVHLRQLDDPSLR